MRLTAIVVAHGPEPMLSDVVEAILASLSVDIEIRLVDNLCSNPVLQDIAKHPRVTVLSGYGNTGFAGGCNLAAQDATGDVLAFVNSDALVEPDALKLLASALDDERTGLVCAKILLLRNPSAVNSVGNPVHYSLLSWAGGWGQDTRDYYERRQVASITGCVFAIRHRDWVEFGGFHDQLFAYGEDVELSMRTWLSGRTVECMPEAIALHDYEFSRSPMKMYWLERNRLINLVTLLEARTLALMTPILTALELGIVIAALRGGWFRKKVAGYGWLLRHVAVLKRRRQLVQSHRTVADSSLFEVLSDEMLFSAETGMAVPASVNRVLARYGAWLRRRLGAATETPSRPPRARTSRDL